MKFINNLEKPAIIYDNKKIYYNELISKAKYIANECKIEKDSKSIIFMENRPELLYTFLGIWDKDATCICIDFSSTVEELSYYIDDSDATRIFTSNKNREVAVEAIFNLKKEVEIIVVDEINYEEYKGEDFFLNAPHVDTLALMLYTSGTTGKPKGVMISFDNILLNIEALDKYNMFLETDIILAFLPMHHIFPLLGSAIVPLYKGSTIVFLKEISSNAMIEAFQTHNVTMMLAVPKVWTLLHNKIMEKINSNFVAKLLFKLCRKVNSVSFSKKVFKKVGTIFGKDLRFFVSGGSKLEERISRNFLTLGIIISEGYGMTETAPMVTFTHVYDVIPGCAGTVISGVEVKISDEGEILVKGRNVMKGYYKKPKETAEMIDADGWLHTGDLGRLTEDNHLYVTGRSKEMIVLANGKNINPIEIEEKLKDQTNLIDEIVISEIDGLLTAIVFPDFQQIRDSKITNIKETLKFDLIDKYNRDVPDYKKILDIKITTEELPKTKIGKIRRFMIPDFINRTDEDTVIIPDLDFEEYRIIKEYLTNNKPKKVTPKSHLELDLGMDSLDIVEFIYFLESRFGINVTENLISENPTVEDLSNFIKDNKDSEKYVEDISWNELLNKDVDVKLPKIHIILSFMKLLINIVFKIYFKMKVKNADKIDKKPAIYVGNHQSFLDGVVLNYALPLGVLTNTYYLAKISHFKNPIMKFFAKRTNIVVFDINKNVAEVLQIMAALLRQNKNVVIFPEGTRTRDGNLNEFKKSFAILAKETGVDIQPFGLKGAYEAMPPNKKMPKRGPIEIEFLERFSPENLTYEEITEKAFNQIKDWIE